MAETEETPDNSVVKSWCYTLNNPTEKETEQLKLLHTSLHRCCLEIGEEEETPHYQGAIVFKRGYRFTQLKKLFPRVRWSHAKVRDAENYCIKGDIIIDEYNRKQGTRTDLQKVEVDIKQGMNLKEISKNHFSAFIKHYRGLEKWYDINSTPRDWVTEVIILWGDSDTGKTWTAIKDGAKKVYWKNDFFYGNVSAETVLFDEFDDCKMERSLFLEITDRHECTVFIKGGSVNWAPRKIYFTSNINPKHWAVGWDAAVRKRITRIEHLKLPKA